jgi:hypothetical protein
MQLPPYLLAQIWEVSWDLCHCRCAHKWSHGAVVEAQNPHGMDPRHLLQTYTRSLTTFICCGWEYGSIILPLLPHFLAQIWEVSWDLCHMCAHKWFHGTVVEALNPHKMVPTFTPNIYKVIDSVQMLWMGVWIHHHAFTVVSCTFELRHVSVNCT